MFCGGTWVLISLFLFGDDRLDRSDRAVGYFDVDHVGADLVDRGIEADLAAIDLDGTGVTDRLGDLLGGDGAVELAVFTGTVMDGQNGLGEERRGFGGTGQGLALGLLGLLLAADRFLERTGGGRLGQSARSEEVTEISGRDLDGGAVFSEAFDVSQQDCLRRQRSPTYGSSATSRARLTATASWA